MRPHNNLSAEWRKILATTGLSDSRVQELASHPLMRFCNPEKADTLQLSGLLTPTDAANMLLFTIQTFYKSAMQSESRAEVKEVEQKEVNTDVAMDCDGETDETDDPDQHGQRSQPVSSFKLHCVF